MKYGKNIKKVLIILSALIFPTTTLAGPGDLSGAVAPIPAGSINMDLGGPIIPGFPSLNLNPLSSPSIDSSIKTSIPKPVKNTAVYSVGGVFTPGFSNSCRLSSGVTASMVLAPPVATWVPTGPMGSIVAVNGTGPSAQTIAYQTLYAGGPRSINGTPYVNLIWDHVPGATYYIIYRNYLSVSPPFTTYTDNANLWLGTFYADNRVGSYVDSKAVQIIPATISGQTSSGLQYVTAVDQPPYVLYGLTMPIVEYQVFYVTSSARPNSLIGTHPPTPIWTPNNWVTGIYNAGSGKIGGATLLCGTPTTPTPTPTPKPTPKPTPIPAPVLRSVTTNCPCAIR